MNQALDIRVHWSSSSRWIPARAFALNTVYVPVALPQCSRGDLLVICEPLCIVVIRLVGDPISQGELPC
jgi:hypothetical protein